MGKIQKMRLVVMLTLFCLGGLFLNRFTQSQNALETRQGRLLLRKSAFLEHASQIIAERSNHDVKPQTEGAGALVASNRWVSIRARALEPKEETQEAPYTLEIESEMKTPQGSLPEFALKLWGLKEGSTAWVQTKIESHKNRRPRYAAWLVRIEKVCALKDGQKNLQNCASLPPDGLGMPALDSVAEFASPQSQELVARIFSAWTEDPYVFLTEYCFVKPFERCRLLVDHLVERIEASMNADSRLSGRYQDALRQIVESRPERAPEIARKLFGSVHDALVRSAFHWIEFPSPTPEGADAILDALDARVPSWNSLSEETLKRLRSSIPVQRKEWIQAFAQAKRAKPPEFEREITLHSSSEPRLNSPSTAR